MQDRGAYVDAVLKKAARSVDDARRTRDEATLLRVQLRTHLASSLRGHLDTAATDRDTGRRMEVPTLEPAAEAILRRMLIDPDE